MPFGSMACLMAFEERPGVAVLRAHEPAELQPDAVVLVDHPAVRERRLDGHVPDLVVQRLGLGGSAGASFSRNRS